MKKQLLAVEAFHNAFGQDNGTSPRLLLNDEFKLRYELMKEENGEYLDACLAEDLTEIADALGDKLYILCGTILRHGMQDIIEKVFDEIQASNMSKLGEDGKPIFREDGKILKGPNFFKPNINQFI
jgi:predicted HAD superfamily Cof-like phosphohydrolase